MSQVKKYCVMRRCGYLVRSPRYYLQYCFELDFELDFDYSVFHFYSYQVRYLLLLTLC